MAELIELGEEIGGDLQSTELEEEVPRLDGGVVGFFVGGSAAAASEFLLQAGAEKREKPHQGMNWIEGIGRREQRDGAVSSSFAPLSRRTGFRRNQCVCVWALFINSVERRSNEFLFLMIPPWLRVCGVFFFFF